MPQVDSATVESANGFLGISGVFLGVLGAELPFIGWFESENMDDHGASPSILSNSGNHFGVATCDGREKLETWFAIAVLGGGGSPRIHPGGSFFFRRLNLLMSDRILLMSGSRL